MITQDSPAVRLPEQLPGMSMKLTDKIIPDQEGVGGCRGGRKNNEERAGWALGGKTMSDCLALLRAIFNQRVRTDLGTVR